MNTSNTMNVDRIESHKIQKVKKRMLFYGIALIIIPIVKYLTSSINQLTRAGWWIDTLLFSALPAYFLLKTQHEYSKRKFQFIEWTDEKIIYRLKNESSEKSIQRNLIEIINIHLDYIEIFDTSNQKYILDISDFDDYGDRLKIKENFKIELDFINRKRM